MIRKAAITGILGLLFLYSAWDFYVRAIIYDPMAGIDGGRKSSMKEQASAGAARHAQGWSSVIVEGNLFSPDRTYREKPIALSQTAPVPEPPKKPEISLRGIIMDSSGEYAALLEINKAKAATLRFGDRLEDVEVTDISERRVMLKWNTENMELKIDKIKTISNPRLRK